MRIATDDRRSPPRAARGTGFVLGVALVGALDEIAFHQQLQWHHVDLDTTPFWQVFSDGLFHAFTAALWFVGALLLWRRRRHLTRVVGGRPFWAGELLGMGAFQLFDGVVNHKVLGLHPVRAGVDPAWPYDLAWIASGFLLLALGWLVRRSEAEEGRPGEPS